jgi:hypothetical protein
MRRFGAITQLHGYKQLDITCTSQRITDLRKRGYNILTRYERSASGARYAVWSLGRKKT